MGLAERRRIAEFKQKAGAAEHQLKDALGFDLPVTLDSSSFPEDAKVLDGYQFYEDYGVPMVTRVIKDICRDDMGKEALKSKIKSITIVNTSKNGEDSGNKSLDLDANGRLTINYGFYQYSDMLWDENELKAKIENML